MAASASADGTPTRRSLSLNPSPDDMDLANLARDITTPAPEPLTNAQRFAIGLPPLTPRRLGMQVWPRAVSSPLPPVTQTCIISVTGIDGTDYGFVKPQWNGFGEYGVQATKEGALEILFTYSPDSPNSINLQATNGQSAARPLMGAVSGFASTSNEFSAGSYNYAYVAGTTQTAAGAPPDSAAANSFTDATGIPESSESAVWIYDPVTQALTAQWINTDGSMPGTHIVWADDSNRTPSAIVIRVRGH
ncbi:hypothetical protein B0H13DRAFT_1885117 [Mycena leptocephala]|nr:hypothetical protein B0H13DRAFT_1885117 [Mycena leptocephala]